MADERNVKNNANNIRNAADVAVASKNPYGVAIGGAVKGLDKVTGGKSTEALGSAMTRMNKFSPGGKRMQKLSNKLNDSGASDKIGKAASTYNGVNGNSSKDRGISKIKGAKAPDTQNQVVNKNSTGGEQESSLPSSLSGNDNNAPVIKQNQALVNGKNNSTGDDTKKKKSFFDRDKKKDDDDSNTDEENSTGGKLKGALKFSVILQVVLFITAPFLILLFLVMVFVGQFGNFFGDFEDAFGISQTTGQDTGDEVVVIGNQDQQKFYDRVNNIAISYQNNGMSVDTLKVVAVFHIILTNGADLDYASIKDSDIKQVIDSMFDGNMYDEELFKNNLINTIIPKYLPKVKDDDKKTLVDEIFEYIENYYDLIGKEYSPQCSSVGSCSYDIKGFYINGSGNVSKNINASNIKVRLMECGSPYGNGDNNKAIDQPLVDFENYVGGVTYAVMGTNAPAEAIKAQMVVARSYALARAGSSNSNSGKKLEQENNQWILQISSCASDQEFCNINQGCSYMGNANGRGGIIKSGIIDGAFKTIQPIPANDKFRSYLHETQGEVLTNSQGYIINTSYTNTEQQQFIELANKGLNYKQILLQVYNQGDKNYKASNIQKSSCDTANSGACISTGEFSNWKQYEGPWTGVQIGNSGSTIRDIGCLATSISILIAKSGVPTNISNFNPGTFVEYMNTHGGFDSGGNFQWAGATAAAPSFKYQGRIELSGMDRQQKLNTIKNIVNQKGVYAVAEVKGNTGQHWVAIDSVVGDKINMMDPGSKSTDMWVQYNWVNTSALVYYRVIG